MTTDWISPFGCALARLDEVEADLALWADRAVADVIAEEVHAARAAISEGLGAVAVALNRRNERSGNDA